MAYERKVLQRLQLYVIKFPIKIYNRATQLYTGGT